MAIGSLPPIEREGGPKSEEIRDETTPLLPIIQENGGFSEFDGASFSGAVFNLSTSIVGAGIMALPATMKVLGLVPGILMIIFVAFLTESSIEMLIRFSRAGKTTSYGGLMGDAFGRFGRMLLQVTVTVNNMGMMIVYMIIIGMKSQLLFDFQFQVIMGCFSILLF